MSETLLAALKIDGMLLKYVPESLQTEELCKIAAAQNFRACSYIKSLDYCNNFQNIHLGGDLTFENKLDDIKKM